MWVIRGKEYGEWWFDRMRGSPGSQVVANASDVEWGMVNVVHLVGW